MTSSADELSLPLIQPSVRPSGRKRSRSGRSCIAPSTSRMKFQLPSRPILNKTQYVPAPADPDEYRLHEPIKRRRPKNTAVAAILSRHHATTVGVVRRADRLPRTVDLPLPQPQAKAGGAKKKGRSTILHKEARDFYWTKNDWEVDFHSMPCLWQECKAELMNMDRLRKHIEIVHWEDEQWSPEDKEKIKLDNGIPNVKSKKSCICRWGRCATNPKLRDKTYEGWAELETHLEEAHLVPYSWHMGDGIRNSSVSRQCHPSSKDQAIPDWLCDKDGNQVTQDARTLVIEDQSAAAARKRRLKAYRQQIWSELLTEDEDNST